MKWFHASPKDDLHITGIDPAAKPLVSRRVQNYVYFGSLDYIEDQYLRYAPKGDYYVYEIDTGGLSIDPTELAGEQIRTWDFVKSNAVTLYGLAKNGKIRVYPE